ncbi:MAG: hypothetical protein ACJAVK_001304 [Akkermansiaceae bacterium]|jgi:hypothetical protein
MPKNGNNTSADNPVTLKVAAATFDCAVSSLKNNIKSGKLSAQQENPKSPFMARLADVERFLRETPGIASCFHPKKKIEPESISSEAETSVESELPTTGGAADTPFKDVTVPNEENAIHSNENSDNCIPNPVDTPPAKRRRNRRRGKGGGGAGSSSGSLQAPVLKALDGASPTERLRVIACLNEIATIVASA